jgi:hypothetical protein
LRLIPQMEGQLLILLLTTLKNYITARYNAEQNRIGNDQKDILRSALFDLFY